MHHPPPYIVGLSAGRTFNPASSALCTSCHHCTAAPPSCSEGWPIHRKAGRDADGATVLLPACYNWRPRIPDHKDRPRWSPPRPN